MSVVVKSVVERSFDEALRDAESWTYRTSVGFDVGAAPGEAKKAYRLGDVRDVFVERENFESSMLAVYRGVKLGTVSRIIAGTGVGKSTKMPVALSLSLECISFVVCPTHAMAGSLADYVSGFIVGTKFEACRVTLVKTYTAFTQLVKPAVAYMGASEFLAMLSMHQQLFRERSVGFVYLDESHERIPAYAVCRLLVSLNFFKDTKVFMGSATASNQNMEVRSEGVKQVVKLVKPENMEYDNVQAMSSKSPLHYSCLSLRTLVFVPTEKQFSMLYDYYEANAVHVRLLKHSARHSDITELNEFLDSVKYTVVVLATPAHQTGYTFAVDAVIDCGVTPYLCIDASTGDVEKRDRVVTDFERVQRAGRVGRFTDGVAYQVDAEPASEEFELYSGSEIYVVLWCKVFSIDVSIAYLRNWAVMLKDLSVVCAKNLLCSRLHPAIMLHYMDSEGKAYAGTRHIFGKLLGRTEAVVSSNRKLSDEVLSSWVTKVMTSDVVGELVGEFKSPCQMPVDWLPVACVLYNAIAGVSVTSLFGDGKIRRRDLSSVSDSGSVVSYALSGSSFGSIGSGSFLDPRVSVEKPGFRRYGDITPEDSISVVAERIVRESSSLKSRDRSVSQSSRGSGRPSSSKSNRDSSDLQRVASANATVRKSDDRKRASVAESASSRSSRNDMRDSTSTLKVDKDQVRGVVAGAFDKEMKKVTAAFSDLRRSSSADPVVQNPPPIYSPRLFVPQEKVYIKAAKLLYERIRPVKDSQMDKFRNLRISQGYVLMYDRLVDRSVVVGNMPKDVMIEYFLASVVAWNTLVSDLFHFRASPHTGLFADTRNKAANDKFESKLSVCRGILELFHYHGMKLALYQGLEQSGIAEPTEDLMRAQAMAQYMQRIGNYVANEAVERAKYCVRMSNEYGGVSGHYFVDGNVMLLVKHVFNEVHGDGTYMIFPRTDVASMRMFDDQRVYKCRLTINSVVRLRYRLPVVGETVVVVAYLQRDVPDVFGVYTITSVGGSGVYDARLSDGMSGAPLISLTDGYVVGLHHGRFVDGESAGFSEFVTVA